MLTVWVLPAPALLVSGCAIREKHFVSSDRMAAAEGYLKESRRKHLPSDKRIGFLLAAAHASWNELTEGEAIDQAHQVYNTSIAALTAALRRAPAA